MTDEKMKEYVESEILDGLVEKPLNPNILNNLIEKVLENLNEKKWFYLFKTYLLKWQKIILFLKKIFKSLIFFIYKK